MSVLAIHKGEWVVVCDGKKALVFENVGDAIAPKLKAREVHDQPDLATHELGADEPGRAFSPADGHGRGAVEQTDWHDQAEQVFLGKLAKRLDAAVSAGEVKTMIVVAPPRALGVLRNAYSHALKSAVRAEMHKDFVKTPVNDIAKHLVA